jgi:8-oxo-dGTP diphosphatase
MEKPEGASILLINKEDDILLFLRDKDRPPTFHIPYPNMWDVLGGHVEKGESPLGCIRREMLEELGLHISPSRLAIIEFEDRVDYVYVEFLWESDINRFNKKLNEGQRVCWFSLDEVRTMKLAYGWQPFVVKFLKDRIRVRYADLDPCSPENQLARDRARGFR